MLNSCEQGMTSFMLIWIRPGLTREISAPRTSAGNLPVFSWLSSCFFAYPSRSSFKLAMQHGAFVQLILTLAAIAARMDALIPEFQDVFQLGWMVNHRILLILDVGSFHIYIPLSFVDSFYR
jgi:hypothetical protein